MTLKKSAMREFQIRQRDDLLELIFNNEPDAVQSAIKPSAPEQLVMQNLQYLMGILLFIDRPKKVLLLGVGGGSLVHFLRFHFPHSHITGVDLDEELLRIAQREMHLPQADVRLDYIIEDAQAFIEDSKTRYDLIVLDIFDGSQTPDWVLALGFTRALQRCLSPRGAVVYNLLINSDRGFEQFYGRLRQVFKQQTLCLKSEQYENTLLYGLNFNPPAKSMGEWLQTAQQAEQRYGLPFHQILSVIFDINPQGGGVI